MSQKPPSTPLPPKKGTRPDRARFRLSFEVVLALGLVIAVGVGLIVAGGDGRWLEVVVLVAGVTIAFRAGWPASGQAALGAVAACLILEAVFGRLDWDHAAGTLVLTV